MAKIIRRRSRKNNPKIKPQKNNLLSFLNRIKFTESYTSLILGAIVVLIVGILFISFAKGNKNTQTVSTKNGSNSVEQISQDSQTSSTYTVNAGDDLWTISENVYHDGFKWIEIARTNKLKNPSLIHSGDILIIPTVAQKIEQNPQAQNAVIKNNSIIGNSYTVVKGDNLWNIAVRAYGDGFRWPDIAKANNLANPSLIHPGNVFIIPR